MAGEQGWIKQDQLLVVGRRRPVTLGFFTKATANADNPVFVSPRPFKIKSAIAVVSTNFATNDLTDLRIGTAATAAAFATFANMPLASVVGAQFVATLTDTICPANTPVVLDSTASAGAGAVNISLEIEYVDEGKTS